MPNISALKKSLYLTKEDVGQGALLTIKGCVEVNVAQEGEAELMKWALLFHETAKPFILNPTNGQIIAGFLGQDHTDNWVNAKIVLFHNPAIAFKGKLVGGISARAPRAAPQPKPAPAPVRPQEPPPVAGQPPAQAWPTEIPTEAEDPDDPGF